METCNTQRHRGVFALRQLLLSSYLLRQTPLECSVPAHAMVWAGTGNCTPHLSFFTPRVEVLLMVSGPVECIYSGFWSVAPKMCLGVT